MGAMSVPTRRWTRIEYERMIDRGIFRDDERLELVDGLLVVKEPQGDPHAHAIDLVATALRQAFGEGWLIRHGPMALGGRSRPEPDVSVVPGGPRDHRRSPSNAALVVEVSHSRLAFDRTRKASMYARAGIADYWIVNLVEMSVEVRRDPRRLKTPERGWAYRSIVTLRPPATITALAAPTAPIDVADLLPS